MDFARKEMEKYGWRDGRGLGKKEDGISNPLKPKLKFDNAGIGHNPGDDFTNRWWENLYNNAVQNLDVKVENGETKLGLKSTPTEITTKPFSVTNLKKNNDLEYGSFLKTSKLTQNGVEHYKVESESSKTGNKAAPLTDEQLFKACGEKLVSQASRFGISMSGKLSRLERQEKLLLKKMKQVSLSDVPKIEKKVKKIKKEKKPSETVVTKEEVLASPLKKKKKKKIRSVSFNETVTEYYPPPEDTGSETSHKDESNQPPLLEENSSSTQDEGIEVDIADKQEEKVLKFYDLSKAERKKLKKKRENRATTKFLAEIDIDCCKDTEGQSRCRKRKLTFDDDEGAVDVKKEVSIDPLKVSKKKKKNKAKKVEESSDHKEKIKSKIKKVKKVKSKDKNSDKPEKQLNFIVQSFDFCKISDT